MLGRFAIDLRLNPRRWQQEALARWVSAGHRGVVEVVTGGGKTLFAAMCMAQVQQSLNARFVVVVPTLSLLDQWFVALTDDTSLSSDSIATYSGEGLPDRASVVNLMVINTARKHAPLLAAESRTALFVDECHRAGSPRNAQALSGEKAASLGLSATPEREYDEGFETVIEPELGHVIYRYGYDDAVSDGILVPFRLVNVAFKLTSKEEHEYRKATQRLAHLMRQRRSGRDVEEQIRRQLLRRARISANAKFRVPAAVRLVEEHPSSRVLVFHESISEAEEIARLLKERGRAVATYHSRLGTQLRRDNLRLFRRGVFEVLVTCRALDEGLNVPEASIAVIASSTASSRQRIQRMGRVLRPAGGKDSAVVYTLYATDAEESRLIAESGSLDVADVAWMRAG